MFKQKFKLSKRVYNVLFVYSYFNISPAYSVANKNTINLLNEKHFPH